MADTDIAAALQAIKDRVAVQQAAEQAAGPKMERVYTHPETKETIHVYSTTGEPQSKAAFEAARDQWLTNETAPKGFIVHPAGTVAQMLRSLPQKASGADTAITNRLLQVIRGGTPVPEGEQLQNVQGPLTMAAQSVDTPGKLGATAGTAIGSLLAAPVTAGAVAATPGAFLARNAILNMLKAGIGATAGSIAGTTLTGQPFNTMQDIVIPFSAAALSQGALGVASHFVQKFLPNVGEKIAKEMIDTIQGQYPSGMVNSPGFFQAAGNSKANIAQLTQTGVKGLRQEMEAATESLITDINQTLPRNLAKGTQNTVRAQLRSIMTAGNKILDNLGDATVQDAAEQEMVAATQAIGAAVKTDLAKLSPTIQQNAVDKVEQILTNKLGESALQSLRQGADVLHALKVASANDGFNFQTFVQAIRGNYQQNPGSLLEQVGKIVGQGTPLTEAAMQPGGSSLPARAANYLIDQIPFIGRHLPNISTQLPSTGPMLPWMQPRQLPAPVNASAVATGSTALRNFIGQERK